MEKTKCLTLTLQSKIEVHFLQELCIVRQESSETVVTSAKVEKKGY